MAYSSYSTARNAFATEEWQLAEPYKRILPKLPDMDVFDPSTDELKQCGNFILEFKKWIPRLQYLYYLGDKDPTDDDIASGNYATITHNHHSTDGPEENLVTQDYYDAYNQYEVEAGEEDDVFCLYTDTYDDGYWASFRPHTNVEAIEQIEDVYHAKVEAGDETSEFDATEDWHAAFVNGIRHHQSEWGPGTESNDTVWAGTSFLQNYTNLSESQAATEWEHIYEPDTTDTMDTDGDQAYYINEDLEALDITWTELNSWAESAFGDKSFYDIVMTNYAGSGSELTAEASIKFLLLLKESKYRILGALETFLGPLASSQDDATMMDYVEDFVNRNIVQRNYISISLFLNIFRIQHEITNFMTGFWLGEGGVDRPSDAQRRGCSQSLLDNYRFYNFAQDWGTRGFRYHLETEHNYDCTYSDGDVDVDDTQSGKLYDYRASYSGLADIEAYNDAVDERAAERSKPARRRDQDLIDELTEQINKFDYIDSLIEDHFGTFYPEFGRLTSADIVDYGARVSDGKIIPLFSDYSDAPDLDDVSGSWESLADADLQDALEEEGFSGYNHIFIPDVTYSSLAYDRKCNVNDFIISTAASGGTLETVYNLTDTQLWIKLHNYFYPDSLITDAYDSDYNHSNYTAPQVWGLTNTYMQTGYYYNHNWVVHAVGELYKNGLGKAYEKINWKYMEQRAINKQYDSDYEDYEDAKDRIAYNKMIEARQLSKSREKRQRVLSSYEKKRKQRAAQRKKALNAISQRRIQQRHAQQRFQQKLLEKKLSSARRKSPR